MPFRSRHEVGNIVMPTREVAIPGMSLIAKGSPRDPSYSNLTANHLRTFAI
jgi:hypothetical protein